MYVIFAAHDLLQHVPKVVSKWLALFLPPGICLSRAAFAVLHTVVTFINKEANILFDYEIMALSGCGGKYSASAMSVKDIFR